MASTNSPVGAERAHEPNPPVFRYDSWEEMTWEISVRTLLIAIGVAFCFALTGADARDDATRIEKIITQQIDAFRKDDAATAFSFASPLIQGRFGTAENFLNMVARGYPQIYRPRSFSFAELKTIEGRTYQRVIVVGPNGSSVAAIYEVIAIAGQWRINGCRIAQLAGESA
ncbi:MAG: DUF4864 domain-containing protein [Hyphomicrobiaceae bacterium]